MANSNDPDVVEAYRKQLNFAPDPALTFLAWSFSDELDQDHLIDGLKAEEERRRANA